MVYPTYVLITPARNEAAFIEGVITSVIGQTLRPVKWVIVSDGSTDETDGIVMRYLTAHDWIELIQMPQRAERHFAGKAMAFNVGFQNVRDLSFDIVGNLDADITFDVDYFRFLMGKFAENPRLGVGGTPFRETATQYDYRFTSIEHVSGACQLFRRACFEEIGGYIANRCGGIDHIAVLTARMKGWKTQTFTEKVCVHHRKMGSANYSILRGRLKVGRLDYALGGHPFWEVCRAVYQSSKSPYVIGGMLILVGYLCAMAKGDKRLISTELVKFHQREQIQRLKELFRHGFRSRGEI